MSDRSPTATSRLGFRLTCGVTILLGAFLLFQVQPLISKIILPWFGGSPAVWTTCMLFFQVLLVVGYAYAHALARLRRPGWQAAIHVGLLLAAAATLPIAPDPAWKPTDSGQPTGRILLLLAAGVGLPYLALSATGPLVQAWFARVCPGRSPYRLYAVSNGGSLAALVTYPFLFEPAFATPLQAGIWSGSFGLFALLCGGLAAGTWAFADDGPVESPTGSTEPERADAPIAPRWRDRLLWLLLPALASTSLLAVTNHVCQEVAVVPFLWVAPLALYLLSFILCFDSDAWYVRRWYAVALVAIVVQLSLARVAEAVRALLPRTGAVRWGLALPDNLLLQVAIFLGVLFLISMVCHGELARRRPHPRYLTGYYLWIAAGGALGGVAVALACPLLFSTYFELRLVLIASLLVGLAALADDLRGSWLAKRPRLARFAVGGATGLLLLVAWGQLAPQRLQPLAARRNYYGVLRVEEEGEYPDDQIRELYHGGVLHGVQFTGPEFEREPNSYYVRQSGLGIALRRYPRTGSRHVGVVGLGTGSVAAYGEPGDRFRFYEINPQVAELAERYFTYLAQSEAEIEVVLGDARLSLEREPPQQFDLLVLDAFSGDAIPVHLLTREAFALYRRHLKPGGVLVVHISNRHLKLDPVVDGLAAELGLTALLVDHEESGGLGEASSSWMLVTDNHGLLADEEVLAAGVDVRGTYRPIRPWTDQYSNLFEILY